jgi:hypothetical protein
MRQGWRYAKGYIGCVVVTMVQPTNLYTPVVGSVFIRTQRVQIRSDYKIQTSKLNASADDNDEGDLVQGE